MATLLFDMDGTLIDPILGIGRSIEYALKKMGMQEISEETKRKFIGPPLLSSFCEYAEMNEKQAETAVGLFRDRYRREGIRESVLYDGVIDMLSMLSSAHNDLYITTSKPEPFAAKIASELGISSYFSMIIGSEVNNLYSTKADIIEKTFQVAHTSSNEREKAYMIGDREHDIIGAHRAGIHGIGVSYGYGSVEELLNAKAEAIIASPREVADYFRTRY